MGTSINTGSDKQTYYKLGLYGADADAPRTMAESYVAGGSMHGDLALVEAALSARAFLHLADLGVRFPQDAFGQFVGYKTDHDPRQRATSVGPYTSRDMCRALTAEVRRRGIPVRERRVVVALAAQEQQGRRRVAGAVALDGAHRFEAYAAENVVLAVGGPGGLYAASVYPEAHTGGIGLALAIGATAQNLPESQYGLASTRFRWNVSGTYMQVVPRFVSTDAAGRDTREFLRPYFETPGRMHSLVFLKGYQWPFDARKLPSGSSLIDLLVYVESVVRGRRVFLDFRTNPEGFDFAALSAEARDYLTRSRALQATPLARLRAMNPAAVALYRTHGIDLARVPLEIAVCAQHNNGGLAANPWWESVNVAHLFPVGEVNGSHGVYRPGGSALNSGQVGGIRAAEYIAARCGGRTSDRRLARAALGRAAGEAADWLRQAASAPTPWQAEREALRRRMSRAAAHIRSAAGAAEAAIEAAAQWRRLAEHGCAFRGAPERAEALRTRSLCLAHRAYLEAIRFAIASGVGSRGSAVVLDRAGTGIHPALGADWSMAPENPAFRESVLETTLDPAGEFVHRWVPCRPIPACDAWFETAWAAFREGRIYGAAGEA
jgi:succinate dehydrogenase/fumarate reductase flavoprotein subunit